MTVQLGRFHGFEDGISEVTLAHLYRAEVSRSTQWRTRLDTTTNWAITTAAAVISFSFSSPATPHATVLTGAGLVFTFLVVEARRYRYYDMWARRVRLIETGYFGPQLRREPVTVDFYSALASELSKPRIRISAMDALAFRLRRIYAPVILLLLGAWVIKLDLHPRPALGLGELVERARIGPLPGQASLAAWLVLLLGFAWLLWYGNRAPLPPTELRAPARRHGPPLAEAFRAVGPPGHVRLGSAPPTRARPEDRLA